MMPYDVPVTQPGSAVHQKTSSGWRSSASAPVTWCATTAPCTWTAPFGLPVVPLVKWRSAMSSGSVGGISNAGLASARSAAKSSVPGVRVAAAALADEDDVPQRRERGRAPARPSCGRAPRS